MSYPSVIIDDVEEPPDDWPAPIDELTPEALEIARRSVAMVEAMGHHYRDWAQDAKAPLPDAPAEKGAKDRGTIV